MQSGRRPEAIDTRWVFRVYAALACSSGFLLFGWGPMWLGVDLPGLQFGKAALIRVAGSVAMAAGCCALGFAAVDRSRARRRGLFWFAVAHAIVGFVTLTQQFSIWNSSLGERAVQILWSAACALFYVWATSEGESAFHALTGLFGGAAPDSTEQLRSQYERQVRRGLVSFEELGY